MSQTNSNIVSVRYMIDDVDAAVAFYTNHLGFHLDVDASPAFASVVRGNLRLLLSGAKSSGRQPLADGTKPIPGGWNRILLEVSDINGEAARLRAAGVKFGREDIVSGPGGSQFFNSCALRASGNGSTVSTFTLTVPICQIQPHDISDSDEIARQLPD